MVEIRESPGKGRGLFLKKDCKAGDLLLCAKVAFAQVPNLEDKNWIIHVHVDVQLPAIGFHGLLLGNLIRKLKKNLELLKEFSKLDGGGYEATVVKAVEGEPVIDTFHINRIMRHNSFSLDMTNESKYPSACLSMGVFITASYINHSCPAKAARSFIGDMSIVRAEYDMRAGTELTIQYLNSRNLGTPQVHVDRRTEKIWGFKCDRRLCAMARVMQNDLVVEIEDLLTMYISVCSDVVQKSVDRELTKKEYAVYKRVMIKIGVLMGIWDTQVPEGFEAVPRLSLAPDHDDFMNQFKSEFGGDSEMLIQAVYKGLVQGLDFDIVKQGLGEAHEGSKWNRGWGVFEVKRWGVGSEYA